MAATGITQKISVKYDPGNRVNLSENLPVPAHESLKKITPAIIASGKNSEDENSNLCDKKPLEDYPLNYSANICILKNNYKLSERALHNIVSDPKSFYAPRNTIPEDSNQAAANAVHSMQKLKEAFGENMTNRIIKEGKVDPRSTELRRIVDFVALNYFNPRQIVMLLNMIGDTTADNSLYYGIETHNPIFDKSKNPEDNHIQPDCLRASFSLVSMFAGSNQAFQFEPRNNHNEHGGRDSKDTASSAKAADNRKEEFSRKNANLMDRIKQIYLQDPSGPKDPDEMKELLGNQIDRDLQFFLSFQDINYMPVTVNPLIPMNASKQANFRDPQGNFIYRPGDIIYIPVANPVYLDDEKNLSDGPMEAQRQAELIGYDTGSSIGLKTPPFHFVTVVGVDAQTGEPLVWSIDGANKYAPGNIMPLSILAKTTIAANSPAVLLRNPDLKPQIKN